MRLSTTLLLLALAATTAKLRAQDDPQGGDAGSAALQEHIQGWIQDLGSEDIQVRQRAVNGLREHASDARSAVEHAAHHSTDPEVQWNASWLSRELASGSTDPSSAPLPGNLEPSPLDDPLGARWRQEFHGLRDEIDSILESLQAGAGVWRPHRFGLLFDDLDELRQQMLDRGNGSTTRSGESISFQRQPDGSVKLEVTTVTPDGKTDHETYQAESMEALAKAHPEIVDRYGLRGGDGESFSFGLGDRIGPAPGRPGSQLPPSSTPLPLDGERLGVMVRPVDDAARKRLSLAEDQGLEVARVERGTLAERLGVETGDVLLEINGTPVHDPSSVREALSAIAPGATVEVVVARGDSDRVVLEAEKPGHRPRWY